MTEQKLEVIYGRGILWDRPPPEDEIRYWMKHNEDKKIISLSVTRWGEKGHESDIYIIYEEKNAD